MGSFDTGLAHSRTSMDNCYMMLKFSALPLLLAGMLLLGNAHGQQAPAKAVTPPPANLQTPSADKSTGTTPAKTSDDLTLTTPEDIFSYAFGMNVGQSLQTQGVRVNPDVFARGLKDTLAGGKTLLSDDEAKAALARAQNAIRQEQQAKMKKEGEVNKKEGDEFLAANKTKEGVVTLPSGLQYRILKAGTGPRPQASDVVVCNYRGTLLNGAEFDSSYKRGTPAIFPVNGVIKGWTEGLQLMPVGSKWQLFVPPDLAYGDHAIGQEVGANSALIFEVELISIQPPTTTGAKNPDKDSNRQQ
jgi:FKBP-type peptidyl-prolyl cis-trans isomerase